MAKFAVLYKGGAMAETPEAQEAVIQQWMQWFGTLGPAVTDFGNPFGASSAVHPDGSAGDATAGVTGYSIVEADGIDRAREMVKGCPVLAGGGSIEIYEAMPM